MTGRTELLQRMLTLQRDGTPFALATVVSRRAPVSAHLGDLALILADGEMLGFVGGACSREIVRQQALEVLRLRQGRLVSISPDATAVTSDAGRVIVPMTCASEGAVEVYIEPFLPAPALVVVGATPVADALARLARAMDYAVTRVVAPEERAGVAAMAEALGMAVIGLDVLAETQQAAPSRPVVVASQGAYDEEALEAALASGSPYVGLLASHRRGETVRAYLEDRHVPGVAVIRSPVGLDLGARTPQEIALSILAEIVRDRASTSTRAAAPPMCHARTEAEPVPAPAPVTLDVVVPEYAVDPVCGMKVDIAKARHKAEVDGVTYYFCCPHCRAAFLEKPQDYLRSAS
jgi:xanthine dehydrogenase accessory factor